MGLFDVHCGPPRTMEAHLVSGYSNALAAKQVADLKCQQLSQRHFYHYGNSVQRRLFCSRACSAVPPTIFGAQMACESNLTASTSPTHVRDYNCLLVVFLSLFLMGDSQEGPKTSACPEICKTVSEILQKVIQLYTNPLSIDIVLAFKTCQAYVTLF